MNFDRRATQEKFVGLGYGLINENDYAFKIKHLSMPTCGLKVCGGGAKDHTRVPVAE